MFQEEPPTDFADAVAPSGTSAQRAPASRSGGSTHQPGALVQLIEMRESWPQLVVSRLQMFADDFHITDDGHEVCVAIPARHNMEVSVLVDSSPSDAARFIPGLHRARLALSDDLVGLSQKLAGGLGIHRRGHINQISASRLGTTMM